jgi:flavorubredoxin
MMSSSNAPRTRNWKMPSSIIREYPLAVRQTHQEQNSGYQKLGLEIDMIAPDHGVIWRSSAQKVMQDYLDMANRKGPACRDSL